MKKGSETKRWIDIKKKKDNEKRIRKKNKLITRRWITNKNRKGTNNEGVYKKI